MKIFLQLMIMLSVLAVGFCLSAAAAPKGGIPESFVQKLQATTPAGADQVLGDIVANKEISDIALNRQRYIAHNKLVNFKIKTGDITNQKGSGRCWMFSALNVFRAPIIRKYKLKNFEFSQNYLMFWDKLEKANFFFKKSQELQKGTK